MLWQCSLRADPLENTRPAVTDRRYSGVFQTFKPSGGMLLALGVNSASRSPLVSCPTLLLAMGRLAGTPSPGPPRLKKAPAAVHPLPQGGEKL
jgi:hypothetical protein